MTIAASRKDLPRTRQIAAGLARQYGILAVLALLVIVAIAIYPGFAAPKNIENLLTQNFTVGVIAVGMTLVIISGGFDLSVGSTYALCAVVYAGVSLWSGVPAVGAAAAIGVGALCGIVNALLVAGIGINPFIATLGTMSLFSGIAYVITNSTPFVVADPGFKALARASLFGVPWSIIILVLVFALGAFVMSRTAYGRSIYAVGGNREASWLSGVRVRSASGSVYVVVGIMAALGALMDGSRLGVGQANVGGTLALDAITVVIIGGTALTGGHGAIWRSAVGLIILATITNIFYNANVSQQWQLVAKGVIVIVAVTVDVLIRSRQPRA